MVFPIVGQPVAAPRLRLPVPVPMHGPAPAAATTPVPATRPGPGHRVRRHLGPAYRITPARVSDLVAEARAAAGAISIRLGGIAG